MNEAWSPKKPIWGKPVRGQFPGYIQPQPLSSHRRGLSYPIVCIHHILLIHSSVNGHLGCFLKDNFIKLFKRIAILDRNLFKSSCVPDLLYEKEVGYGVEISRPLGFDLRIRSLVGFLSFELRTRSSKPKSQFCYQGSFNLLGLSFLTCKVSDGISNHILIHVLIFYSIHIPIMCQ